jgi:polyisoprenoid-binding protein YceI
MRPQEACRPPPNHGGGDDRPRLEGRFHGIGKDLEGKERIAFDASRVVDRRDYGMRWNQVLEGSNTIGDDVEITIALEAVRSN